MVRAACYARYSSDLQKETSIEDQLRIARDYAARHGWSVPQEHIYSDSAISGASIEGRAGIQRLLAAASGKPRPFEVVLVDDSSRVARDVADAIRFMQHLKFLGVRVIYISQGIDSDSDQADALVTVHGLIDSLYLKELGKKVKRGLAGQIERGFATGAKTYGFRTIPVPDPSGKKDPNGGPALLGKRIEIDPSEADVIRQIFDWAATGVGAHTIVDRLNRAGIVSPRGKRWAKGAVLRLLQNERYLGRQIWGQRNWERKPGSASKVARPVPRHDWTVVERPDLRIISDELWSRVQETRDAIRKAVAQKSNLLAGEMPGLYLGICLRVSRSAPFAAARLAP
jgi:site-specific DNA recombinase